MPVYIEFSFWGGNGHATHITGNCDSETHCRESSTHVHQEYNHSNWPFTREFCSSSNKGYKVFKRLSNRVVSDQLLAHCIAPRLLCQEWIMAYLGNGDWCCESYRPHYIVECIESCVYCQKRLPLTRCQWAESRLKSFPLSKSQLRVISPLQKLMMTHFYAKSIPAQGGKDVEGEGGYVT